LIALEKKQREERRKKNKNGEGRGGRGEKRDASSFGEKLMSSNQLNWIEPGRVVSTKGQTMKRGGGGPSRMVQGGEVDSSEGFRVSFWD